MASGSHRLGAGGRIDRTRPIAFTLEGRRLQGFGGDTLAAALLAQGVSLLGRSFKYHRPRGLLAAGVEEPNGLVTLGEGGGRTPNVPATTVELHEGIVARRQNGWPSVDVDVMAALTACATPLLGAGFYYKTFMGPRRGSWMLYEPYIRRAAGLGQGTHAPDPDRYETRHAFTDVLVIGAGPAGLAAARAAAAAGARVMLIEQDFALGGSLLCARSDSPLEPWRIALEAELRALPNLAIGLRTTALGVYDGNTLALLERHDHARPDASRGVAREGLVTLRTRAIVYATGATERPLVFADNDRPGVMLSSAVRAYLNRYAVAAGRRAVLATNNDSAYATALDLAAAGVPVTVLDERASPEAGMVEATRRAGVDVRSAVRVARALGGRALRAVEFEALAGGRTERLDADLLGMSGGWSPVVHLTSHTGRKPTYRAALDSFVPGGYAAGHFGAGALMGSLTLSAALAEGHEAGQAAAAHAGRSRLAGAAPVAPVPDERVGFEASPLRPLKRRGKAFVDFQNDVTTDDIALAHEEGYVSVEHLKRYTTLGMGTDQGKTSNVNAALWMAALRGVELPAAGTTTYRPPYTPVSIGALAGRHTGTRFRPTRRSPLHDWHVANGAVMIEAGSWLRPWYYRWAGDSAAAAYLDEMRLVRGGVGMSDVSTLGKIDVQGPDAAEFLNRVYVNGFAKLPIGKARYGVMLNDDATVLDDGTTARFGDTRYFMTTTTAQAAEVMSWLEFLLQTAWTDLRVQVVSVTDRWAGMSVAGPRARAALELAFPDLDVSNTALPHMGVLEVQVDGVPLRLLRLSFSGELAYELYVPADRGVALWERLLGRAAPLGLKPYGLEALASLRIEKGHVAGLELDHRNTLDDLGLGKMAASAKPYVGRELRERPDLRAAERWSLVGLECLEPHARFRGGAILFARGEAISGHGRGYITSVTWSTVLDKYIALGLYQGGLKHVGEEIVCAYPLKGETVRARVVQPVFVDPAGERLHV
jgi:heterotetrameric sarcosine oxidase alpha subunit